MSVKCRLKLRSPALQQLSRDDGERRGGEKERGKGGERRGGGEGRGGRGGERRRGEREGEVSWSGVSRAQLQHKKEQS